MDVRLDEPGHDVTAARVDGLAAADRDDAVAVGRKVPDRRSVALPHREHRAAGDPHAARSAATKRPRAPAPASGYTVRPRAKVRTTAPVNRRPAYGVTPLLVSTAAGSSVHSGSGSNRTMSASAPALIRPLRAPRPNRSAGFAARRQATNPATLRASMPVARRRASLNTAGSKDCTPATPPQAAKMSSRPFSLSARGPGEGSDATKLIRPPTRPSQRASRLS